MKRRGRRRILRALFWLVLGAAAAIYFADPLMDLIQRGRQAAFGPQAPEAPGLAPTVEVTLFFASAEGDLLVRHPAFVEKGKDAVQTLRNVLAALLEGPKKDGLAPVVPAGAKLRTAVPSPDGTVYVDFDRAFREGHPGGAWSELLTAYAVANTVLFNFRESFERVVILVEGQEAETVAGALSISGPLTYREDLVAKEAAVAAPAPAPPSPAPPPGPPPAAGVPREPLPPVGAPPVGPVGVPAEETEVPPVGAPAPGRP